MCTNEFSKIPLNPPSPRKKTHIYAVVNNIRENDIPAGTYRRQRRRRRRREAKEKKNYITNARETGVPRDSQFL